MTSPPSVGAGSRGYRWVKLAAAGLGLAVLLLAIVLPISVGDQRADRSGAPLHVSPLSSLRRRNDSSFPIQPQAHAVFGDEKTTSIMKPFLGSTGGSSRDQEPSARRWMNGLSVRTSGSEWKRRPTARPAT